MNAHGTGSEIDEASWIKLYVDLTGASESEARNTFMYVACQDAANPDDQREPLAGYAGAGVESKNGRFAIS